MTSAHPVRRILARLCSADTMARVVDPTLADVRWEHGRPAWRGYWALVTALTVHGVTSTPGAIRRVYSDDGHAMPRVGAYTIGGAVALAVLLNTVVFVNTIRHAPATYPFVRAFVLLLPPALIVTLPAALLIAIPLALKRQVYSTRLARRVVVLSMGCAAVTFALLIGILPESNQAYRVLISGNEAIPRGRSEAGLAAARREIERMRTFQMEESLVRRLEFEYHGRLALASTPVPLGLLALGLTRRHVGRRRPMLFGGAALAFYVCLLMFSQWQRPLVAGTAIAPSLLAWLPNLLVAVGAAILVARSNTEHEALSTSTKH